MELGSPFSSRSCEAMRSGRICGEDRQEIYEIASPEAERRV